MNLKLNRSENPVVAAPTKNTSFQQLVAEIIGTAFLLSAVVGSGIMGERLSGGNVAIALLANSLATGCALIVLILIFAPISGGHFNPAVTLSAVLDRKLSLTEAGLYILAQVLGAILGVLMAHLMFGYPLWTFSVHVREGWAQCFSEAVATFGLLAVIHGCRRYSTPIIAVAIGGYITSAYWFTSSTSFANPAVTLARAITDTFAGIRPNDVLPFVASQVVGAFTATLFFRWLLKERTS